MIFSYTSSALGQFWLSTTCHLLLNVFLINSSNSVLWALCHNAYISIALPQHFTLISLEFPKNKSQWELVHSYELTEILIMKSKNLLLPTGIQSSKLNNQAASIWDKGYLKKMLLHGKKGKFALNLHNWVVGSWDNWLLLIWTTHYIFLAWLVSFFWNKLKGCCKKTILHKL